MALMTAATPGPGEYETNDSSVISQGLAKRLA